MPAGAVAGWIRGRALLHRRVGAAGARQLAAAGSTDQAVSQLARSAYGRAITPGSGLRAAQRAVEGAALWNLRILAGWQPAGPAAAVGVLAGGFEIINIVDLLVGLRGGDRGAPFDLGSLATAWRAVRTAGSGPAVRAALGRSGWGDPGDDDPGHVLLALELAWARRVSEQVPGAAGWARDAVRLMERHIRGLQPPPLVTARMRRDIDSVLRTRVPRPDADPAPSDWPAWWRAVERDARAMAGRGPGPEATIGVAALLLVDAWRARAALALSGGPGGDAARAGMIDAVA